MSNVKCPNCVMSVNMCAAAGVVTVSRCVGFYRCGDLPVAIAADAVAAFCQSNGAVDDVADALVAPLRVPFVLFFQHLVPSVVVVDVVAVAIVASPVDGRRQWNQQSASASF